MTDRPTQPTSLNAAIAGVDSAGPVLTEAERRAALPAAARRALEEADARRAKAKPLNLPEEWGGRDGPEAVRYGDWEKKGIAIDF